MGEPIFDVGTQHREHAVDDVTRPRRPEHAQRLRCRAHHPLRGDHVVQIADVIAVQVREQHVVEHQREHAGSCESHAHPTTRVHEHRAAAGADERRRAGTVTVRQRVPGAE